MPFPTVKRVIYKKNPLDLVVCQLRFPPILKIDTTLPADFQDKIRKEFPNFSDSTNNPFPNELKSHIPENILIQLQKNSIRKNYEFTSDDNIWKINLTRTFIALSCKKYERWELFKQKLDIPLTALLDIYSPIFFTRIGLRYIDVIRRSILGLESVSWNRLLNDNILGLLGSNDLHDYIQNFENLYELTLSDNESKVKILTKFVEYKNNNEKCYMIDSDFYNDKKIKVETAKKKLDFFNKRATRLIQWCITDKLHKAMEPTKL